MLKYILADASFPTLWFGVANVIANALVMLRQVISSCSRDSHF